MFTEFKFDHWRSWKAHTKFYITVLFNNLSVFYWLLSQKTKGFIWSLYVCFNFIFVLICHMIRLEFSAYTKLAMSSFFKLFQKPGSCLQLNFTSTLLPTMDIFKSRHILHYKKNKSSKALMPKYFNSSSTLPFHLGNDTG